MVKRFLFFISFCLSNNLIFSQEVKSIKAEQKQSTIIINYELIANEPCKVDLYVSKDGGSTWDGPLTKVKGKIGSNTTGGINRIEWDVLEEFGEFQFTNVKFQVKASYSSLREVKIGWQTWTAENLNLGTFRNGEKISEAKSDEEWMQYSESGTPAWCYYGNDISLGVLYGRLYNWYAISDYRGLCPVGWKIPDDNDWTKLIDNLGGVDNAGIYLKSKTGWKDNGNGKNNSGFTALPAGYRYVDGSFDMKGNYAYWWTLTPYFDTEAYDRDINYYGSTVNRGTFKKGYGFSVRCIKD